MSIHHSHPALEQRLLDAPSMRGMHVEPGPQHGRRPDLATDSGDLDTLGELEDLEVAFYRDEDAELAELGRLERVGYLRAAS